MTEILFYHLQREPLAMVLPKLAHKALESGQHMIVLDAESSRIELLNQALWEQDKDGFIPHGSMKDPLPEEQPVYLTITEENPNQASILAVVDGSLPAFASSFAKVLDVFDGTDESAVARARSRWKHYADKGYLIKYFQQQPKGNWQLKATANAAASA